VTCFIQRAHDAQSLGNKSLVSALIEEAITRAISLYQAHPTLGSRRVIAQAMDSLIELATSKGDDAEAKLAAHRKEDVLAKLEEVRQYPFGRNEFD
jgi:hypothetical protein